jgi:deazaflavin-dependent oxidoreductase (nitroreductase family)
LSVVAYLRPTGATARLNSLFGKLAGKPTLSVRGRTSGQWRTVPVNVLELDGTRYLVSPRGETEWVRNLRVAGGGEIRRRGRIDAFTAREVGADDRPRVIAAYRDKWDREVKKLFTQLPDPADHPTFRIDPAA